MGLWLGLSPSSDKKLAEIDSLEHHSALFIKMKVPYYALNKHFLLMECDKLTHKIVVYSWQHK